MSDQGIVPTRRAILAAGAGLAAVGAFAGRAAAQGDTDLARVQGARRILIRVALCSPSIAPSATSPRPMC